VKGLAELPLSSGGPALAASLADRWLASNWLGWQQSGAMFEKYDAFTPGEYGGGGEYAPQAGFGWTNGVALELIEAQHGASSQSSFA
jgi:alpha,alpha-trehalase